MERNTEPEGFALRRTNVEIHKQNYTNNVKTNLIMAKTALLYTVNRVR